MAEVHIIEDEAWPTYALYETPYGGRKAEVDPDVLERWKFVLAQYGTVQEEMAAAYEQGTPPPKPERVVPPQGQGPPYYGTVQP